MTDEQLEALGRRWREAKGGWRRGMIDNHGRSVLAATSCTVTWDRYMDVPDQIDRPNSAWPDLRDPATRGAALEVVRERWGAPELQISPRLRFDRSIMDKGVLVGWVYYVNDLDEHFGDAASEAEALVAALESAPPPP